MSRPESRVRRNHLLRLYGATLVVAACGEDSTAPPPPPPAPVAVAFVEVTPAAAGVVIGHTLQLTAKVRDAASNDLQDRAVTWTTNAPTQATVSATGLVQAVALSDTVLITATSEGKSGRARLNVVLDIAGEWNFTEQLSASVQGVTVTCSDTGSFQFNQTGTEVAGTIGQVGTCISQGPLFSSDNTAWA